MLNTTSHQEKPHQNHNETPFTPTGQLESNVRANAGEDVEKAELSCTVGGNVNMVQPLWETVWQLLKKLN